MNYVQLQLLLNCYGGTASFCSGLNPAGTPSHPCYDLIEQNVGKDSPNSSVCVTVVELKSGIDLELHSSMARRLPSLLVVMFS